MDRLWEPTIKVIHAALSLQASILWEELHPDDAHSHDEIQMKREQLDDAIGTYATVRNDVI